MGDIDKIELKQISIDVEKKYDSQLVKNIAKLFQSFLRNKPIDPCLQDTSNFLNHLIPEIEHSLRMRQPTILSEQQVVFSESSAPYKAFPDIIEYGGFYYLAFREGREHAGKDDYGQIRILKGNFDQTGTWSGETVALLSKPELDLRDPKFFIDNNNILRMMIGGSELDAKGHMKMMIPHVAKFENENWSLDHAKAAEGAEGKKGQWIWRVTWNPHDNHGYAFSYGRGAEFPLSLVKTEDGVTFEKIADLQYDSAQEIDDLSEGTLMFREDGTAVAFIRTKKNGLIGTASPSSDGYVKWSFKPIPFRVGGPNCIFSYDQKKMWAGTRHFFLEEDNKLDEATILALMDEKSLIPLLRLKGKLDSSYPGMLFGKDGNLIMVHYAAESEKCSNVFITRVALPN